MFEFIALGFTWKEFPSVIYQDFRPTVQALSFTVLDPKVIMSISINGFGLK